MGKRASPILVRLKYPDHTAYFIWLSREKRFAPLDEKHLSREIPGYILLNEQARRKKFRAFIEQNKIVKKLHVPDILPNAPNDRLSPRKRRSAAKELLSVCNIFESSCTGYLLMADLLCAMHCRALRQTEPGFHPAISFSSDSPEIKKLFKTILKSAVTIRRWYGKHAAIHRKAVLDFRTPSGNFPRHFQDFSQYKGTIRGFKSIKFPVGYVDTPVLIINANKSQLHEAAPYLENAAVIFLNSAVGEFGPTKMTASDIASYDPAVLESLKRNRRRIAKLLHWWWAAFDDEDAWAYRIVQAARASFGKPDSRYIRVELDPKKLRNAIRYRVFLSFLDELEAHQIMTAEEMVSYRQGAKEVFDPAPPEPVAVRRAEDPDVFLEIMKELAVTNDKRIIPQDDRFVKAEKPFAAWRTISGEKYLVFLETDWARNYAKAVRNKKDIDVSFFKADHWEREFQHILADQGMIKQAGSGYRYRYDLMGTGKRDSTYVVAIPAHLLTE